MLTEIQAPTSCPECLTPIHEHLEARSGITTHWCLNLECVGRLRDMLTFIADRDVLEIEGLGPDMAAKLAADGYIKNLADLLEFQGEALQGLEKFGEEEFETLMMKQGFPGALTTRMVNSLEFAKTAPWPKWITALGIPMIGNRLSKKLAEVLELTEDAMAQLPEALERMATMEVSGFGMHKTNEILAAARNPVFQDVCRRLHAAGVRPRPVAKLEVREEAPLAGTAFVITGDFPEIGPRDYIKRQLEMLGAVSKSGVTKKSNLLLVGQEHGATKIKKAVELGIKQVGPEWLIEVFTKYGVEHMENGMELEDVD